MEALKTDIIPPKTSSQTLPGSFDYFRSANMATTVEGEHVLPDGVKLYTKTWIVRPPL